MVKSNFNIENSFTIVFDTYFLFSSKETNLEEFLVLQAQIEQLLWYDWENFLNKTLPGYKSSYFDLDIQGVDQVFSFLAHTCIHDC